MKILDLIFRAKPFNPHTNPVSAAAISADEKAALKEFGRERVEGAYAAAKVDLSRPLHLGTLQNKRRVLNWLGYEQGTGAKSSKPAAAHTEFSAKPAGVFTQFTAPPGVQTHPKVKASVLPAAAVQPVAYKPSLASLRSCANECFGKNQIDLILSRVPEAEQYTALEKRFWQAGHALPFEARTDFSQADKLPRPYGIYAEQFDRAEAVITNFDFASGKVSAPATPMGVKPAGNVKTRAQFSALSHGERTEFCKAGGKLTE